MLFSSRAHFVVSFYFIAASVCTESNYSSKLSGSLTEKIRLYLISVSSFSKRAAVGCGKMESEILFYISFLERKKHHNYYAHFKRVMHTERPPGANAITFRGEDHEKKSKRNARQGKKRVEKVKQVENEILRNLDHATAAGRAGLLAAWYRN